MKLTVLERILLSNILPVQGNFKTLKMLRILKEDLSFSDEENKGLNFQQDGGMLKWNETNKEYEIVIGETMNEIIVGALKELDSSNKLTDQHVSLYEKFIK